MATVNNFEDQEIWQMAREICRKVHEYTRRENFRRDFSLVDQMKRSSGSIMDNIAEGFEREGKQEFIQFLYISKSSSGECRSQSYFALDRKYITEEEHQELYSLLIDESQKIHILCTNHQTFKLPSNSLSNSRQTLCQTYFLSNSRQTIK